MLSGVLGGLGEYFDVDPVILRLAYIFVGVCTAIVPAIIGYVVAALIVPKKKESAS